MGKTTTPRDRAYDFCVAKGLFHNEAEMQVIATMLDNREIAQEIIERGIELGDGTTIKVTPGFFFDPELRLLCEAIVEVADNDRSPFGATDLIGRSIGIATRDKRSYEGVSQVSFETIKKLRDLRPQGHIGSSLETLRKYDKARAAIEFATTIFSEVGPGKDPDEIVAAASEALQSRMPASQADRFNFGYNRAEKYGKTLEKRAQLYAEGKIVDVSYPWPSWRKMFINHRPGKLFTLLVPQNNGKTTIMHRWAEDLAWNGVHVVFVHLEDTDDDLYDRQMCRWAKIPMGILTSGNYTPEVLERKNAAEVLIQKHFDPRLHYLNGGELTMSGLIRHLNQFVAKVPVGAVFVDYMNAISPEYGGRGGSGSYYNEQNAGSVNSLVAWSNRNRVPLVVCDQLNKDGERQVLAGSKIASTFQYGSVQKANASKTILAGARRVADDKPIFQDGIQIADIGEMSPIINYNVAKANDGPRGQFTQAIQGKFYSVYETDEYMDAWRKHLLKGGVSGAVELN